MSGFQPDWHFGLSRRGIVFQYRAIGSVRFDMGARTVAIDGRPIDLTDLEYLLFLALAGRPLPE
jgi:DNA-binding response OmpR family regulator